MAMIAKLLAAAACVATAFGARVTNDGGNMLLQVAEGKNVVFKRGAAQTDLADLQTQDGSSYAASYFHLGYTAEYANKVAEIDVEIAKQAARLKMINDKHAALLNATAAAKKRYDEGAGKEIADLQAKLADALGGGAVGNEVKGVATACRTAANDAKPCGAAGGETVSAAVVGEVYANLPGVFKCTYTWGTKKVHTNGVGQAASATGKLSAVTCDTPAFPQSYLTAVGQTKEKNTWRAALTIKSDGGTNELKFTGATGQDVVPFQTRNPEFIADAAAGFKAEAVFLALDLATGPSEATQIMVHDPDSTSASLKFAFAGADTTHIKKLEAVKVAEADGKVHYSIRATGTGKKASKKMTIRMTVTDQNGGTAKQDFAIKVLFIESVGVGGAKNVLTPAQTMALWNKMGIAEGQLVMCYNAKKHGYNSRTQYTRCANKGATFILARRSNGRVFGGFNDVGLNTNRWDWLRSKDGKAFVWNVKPSTKQIEFFLNDGSGGNDYKHYNYNGYHMYFGNCQALYCDSSLRSCRSYLGCSYATNGLDRRTALTGSERWYEQSSMFYEMYYVKK